MKGRAGYLLIGFAVVLFVGYVSWEWYLSPRARVERALEAAASAAETLDLDALLSHLSRDYSDFLHADREGLETSLRQSFERVDRLNVTLSSIEVEIEGEEATARFDLVVVAIRGEERYVVLGTPFEAEKLEAELVREDDEWRIRRIERAPPSPSASARRATNELTECARRCQSRSR